MLLGYCRCISYLLVRIEIMEVKIININLLRVSFSSQSFAQKISFSRITRKKNS